jgi:HSF-type DNA-binding
VHKFFLRGHPDLCYKVVRRSGSKIDLEDTSDDSMDHGGSEGQEGRIGETNVIGPLLDSIVHPDRVPQRRNSSFPLESEMEAFDEVFEPPLKKDANSREKQQQQLSHTTSLSKKSAYLDLDLRLDDDFEGVIALLNHDGPFTEPAEPLPSYAVQQEDNEPAELFHSDIDEDSLQTDHSFPFKLHLMLENAQKDGYDHIVSWLNDGTSFKVRNSEEFVDKVLPFYFDQSKYESFRRQLNLYGFSRVGRGKDRGVISHPFFVQADRSLCKKITRKPQTKSRTAKEVVSHPYWHRTSNDTATSTHEVFL